MGGKTDTDRSTFSTSTMVFLQAFFGLKCRYKEQNRAHQVFYRFSKKPMLLKMSALARKSRVSLTFETSHKCSKSKKLRFFFFFT